MKTFFLVTVVLTSLQTQAAPLVAPTEPLTPAEQIKKFHLPEGFEIQLVASEPDIQKPMNMNFDTRGRLWVTHSVEYPFPAKDNAQARDGLTVLANIGPDGKAKTITRFADKLNIPIGVQPLDRGREAIVWSIPHIWKLTDTNNDGKANKREILFGPFDTADTHGNQNAFTLGPDGWIYACHGFRNHSKVKLGGKGKVVFKMQSGNTYRFRPDGSAIEQYTHGQVNPFGLCFDPNGDIFTADCHSKPVTMLLRGGYYPSFGKPHDGLGFAPQTTNDDHGSTGIAGITYVQGNTFPDKYNNCLYIGNPITNKIHRDELKQTGSTYRVEKPDDFLWCEDPWFRPVDIQWGPDGALYIADFYNCIIGHYEVDLHHPKRDRTRGRIWRVIYTKAEKAKTHRLATNFTAMTTDDLKQELQDPNLSRRTLALREMVNRGRSGNVPVKQVADYSLQHEFIANADHGNRTPGPLAAQCASSIWLKENIGSLTKSQVQWLAGSTPFVSRQLLKALGEREKLDDEMVAIVRSCMFKKDAVLQRFAANTMAKYPSIRNISALLTCWSGADDQDSFLIHTIRRSLREQLQALPANSKLEGLSLNPDELKRLVDISLAVPTEQAAWFTFEFLNKNETDEGFMHRCMEHVANHLPATRVNDIVAFVQKRFRGNPAKQWALYTSIQTGLDKRGVQPTVGSPMGKWLATLVPQLLTSDAKEMWLNKPLLPGGKSPWGLRERGCTDGKTTMFIDSIVHGEQRTGVLRSHTFKLPAKISFFMCGHNGYPGKNPTPVNHIRLVVDGKVVVKQIPPRHDTARKYTWDLSAHSGKQGVIEIVDADSANAYAWIGVSRFEPAVVGVTGFSAAAQADRTIAAVEMVGRYRLTTVRKHVEKLLRGTDIDTSVRIAAARALSRMGNLEPHLIDWIKDSLSISPARQQLQLAQLLCTTPRGAAALLEIVDQGKASPRLLQDRGLAERFKQVATAGMQSRAAGLLQRVPDVDKALVDLITKRRDGYLKTTPNEQAGKKLFAKHCAACHRIDDVGATIAPALNGIGNRGSDRVIEDILDPNRNVDQAFRTMIIDTKDGDVISGFSARTEGKTLVLSDLQGKAIRVPEADIDSRRSSTHSPMPGNFGELMKEDEFNDLVGYLLSN